MPPKTKTVYLVRHGQSQDNVAPVYPSDDTGLSERGIRQAEMIAERLSKVEFQNLITSPLERAKQTAEIITQQTGMQPDVSQLFVERIKPQSIAGKPWQDPAAAKLFGEWQRSLFKQGKRVADGENFDDIIDRADKAINFLFHQEQSVSVIVTHGFFLSTIVARVMVGGGLTPDIYRNFVSRASVENTSITVLKYTYDRHYDDYAWRLWAFNDHAHFVE